MDSPSVEHIAIHVEITKPCGEHYAAKQSPYNIDAPSGIPVLCSITALSLLGIPMSARHIMGKTAFININKGSARLFMGGYSRLEGLPFVFACLWMAKGVFYVSHPVYEALAI